MKYFLNPKGKFWAMLESNFYAKRLKYVKNVHTKVIE